MSIIDRGEQFINRYEVRYILHDNLIIKRFRSYKKAEEFMQVKHR